MRVVRSVGILAVVIAASTGCAPVIDPAKEVPPPGGAVEAQALVMVMYGSHHAELHWYGNKLDCVDHHGCDDVGVCYLSDNGLGCVAGETWGDVSMVSTMSGAPLHETGLAHELAHVRWDDPDHKGHAFAVGGEVDQANAALVEQGM